MADYYIDSVEKITFTRCTTQKRNNPFYMVDPIIKVVTRSEFDQFLQEYPRPLDCDVYGVCDPPEVSYNDFALADRWPYSIVATTYLYAEQPGNYNYTPEEQRRYSVMVNYKEVFASKTGYMANQLGAIPPPDPYIKVVNNEEGEVVAEIYDVKTCTFDVFANSQVDGGEQDA